MFYGYDGWGDGYYDGLYDPYYGGYGYGGYGYGRGRRCGFSSGCRRRRYW